MRKMMYDVIIIWAWASWLFLWSLLKDKKVALIEKNEQAGNKLLLSWKGRCNFTNLNVNKEHYFWDDLERLQQLFKEFWAQEVIKYFNEKGIETKEEDNGRMFLKSNKSKELLSFLLKGNEENGNTIFYNEEVTDISKENDGYSILTSSQTFLTKHIVIASWWKTFPQIGGSDFIFRFSKKFWIAVQNPTPALCWITTKEDLSSLSWSSVFAEVVVKEKTGKSIFNKSWVILFTHRGISWPLVFNLSLLLWKYKKELSELKIKLSIKQTDITKRLLAYLKAPKWLRNYILSLTPQLLKDRETAKVMAWWVLFDEVNESFELKKAPGIFVLGEALNVTWETWGYNLQWCWTSAYHCAKALN